MSRTKTRTTLGAWVGWWLIAWAWLGCAPAWAMPLQLHGQWHRVPATALTEGSPAAEAPAPEPVHQVAATGGRFRFESRFEVRTAGVHVIDFKNSSVIRHFTHRLVDAAGRTVAERSGGIGRGQANPFFLRHGREVRLEPGRYHLVTEVDSPFFLAHPEPFIDTLDAYRQAIKPGNALTLLCLGVFLGLGVYYGSLAVVRRQRVHAMYALFIAGNLLYNAAALLVFNDLVGTPWFYLISVPILFSNIAYVVFVMDLLELRPSRSPGFAGAGRVVIGAMVLFIGLSVLRPNWSLEFDRVGVALFLVFGLSAGIAQSLRGNRLAQLYVLANVGFFLSGLAAITLVDLDGVFTIFIEHLGLVAVTIEVLLLALVLSYQFGMLRRDKDAALRQAEGHLRLARTDVLTGLPNRYALEQELAGLPPEGSLTFIDLDGLKHYNDHFGHARGDELLQAFARDLSERLDGLGVLHRLGGDEFAATTRDGRCDQVEHRLMASLQALRDAGYALAGASCGSVHAHECAHTDDLKHLADTRMYENKRRRRVRDQAVSPAPD